MIELVVINFLNNKLSCPVYLEKHADIKEYVLVEKTGSRNENKINHATFAIQSYSDSLYKAALLNERVKQAMLVMSDNSDDISKCKLNTDYNYTDTTTKNYRYQAIFEITY